MASFDELVKESNNWITPSLQKVFPDELSEDVTVKASMYSLMAGGKRLRPCLMYYSAILLGVDKDEVIDYATALEMIHTYSLIHDDLPCMDNDDLRRGKPTCHKVYGDGIAVLAGDNLLNRAHEILLNQAIKDSARARAALNVSNLAGINGMIGGQSIDITSEGKDIPLELLYELQRKKTGALIEAAITTPWYLSSKSEDVYTKLRSFAAHMGLAFQIKDDILDVESNAEELGKNVGKDERDNKSTFVTMLSLEGAKAKLNEEIISAKTILDEFSGLGMDVEALKTILGFFAERNY